MDACNFFPFNRLQTLSIAMGVYTPLVYPERSPRRASSLQNRRVSTRLDRFFSFTSHESPTRSPCPGPVGELLGSRPLSPVPLRQSGHGARMVLNIVVTPHRETSPLVPVSKSSRADAGCGYVIHPIPGQVSCRQAGWPGKHPEGCGFPRAGKAGSVRLGQHALLEP
jgi:hypothetical protein